MNLTILIDIFAIFVEILMKIIWIKLHIEAEKQGQQDKNINYHVLSSLLFGQL